jgi:prepilin-type N-terminal cleavage/methylation domain-containing protein
MGFTLIELLVSIAIMAIIMLAFGGLLTQANKVVTEGEKRMRADAAASAISRIIRNDIREASKNGFFRVGRFKEATTDPDTGEETEQAKYVLVLVTAGSTQSSFSDETGDGSVIIYGHYDGTKEDDANVLYRKVRVLSKEADNVPDCIKWNGKGLNFSELQVMDIDEMEQMIEQVTEPPTNMAYPPVKLNQIMNTSWMVLAGGCTDLIIEYRAMGETRWKPMLATYTRHNQGSWPAAIKFKFALIPESIVAAALTDGSDDKVWYEIICPLGH